MGQTDAGWDNIPTGILSLSERFEIRSISKGNSDTRRHISNIPFRRFSLSSADGLPRQQE